MPAAVTSRTAEQSINQSNRPKHWAILLAGLVVILTIAFVLARYWAHHVDADRPVNSPAAAMVTLKQTSSPQGIAQAVHDGTLDGMKGPACTSYSLRAIGDWIIQHNPPPKHSFTASMLVIYPLC